MKKIYAIFLIAILLMPVMASASILNEVSPYIEIIGIDENKYDISKIITSDKVVVELLEKDTDESYSWSFEKDKIGESIALNFNIDFESSKEDEINLLTNNIDKTYLSFSHHGSLPSSADLKVYIGNKYENGQKLNLYYYNDKKNEVELIKENIEVKDGYVEFPIEHCSEYFLSGAIVNNPKQVSKNMNYIIIGLFFTIMILLTYTMFRRK